MNEYSFMGNKNYIINLLLRNPSSLYKINQISRILNISIGSVYKIIKELEKRAEKSELKSMKAVIEGYRS